MAEIRKIIESPLKAEEAYAKLFKRASGMGYAIKSNIKGRKLELEWQTRNAIWWLAFVVGLLIYVLPGILVWALWKPKDVCKAYFENTENGSTITFMLSGGKAEQFYNESVGMLV